MVKKSRIGRPKAYNDRTSTSFSCEKAVLNDFMELCWKEKTSLSEKLQSYMENELKKDMGLTNPIKISYEQQNKVMSLLHYLQDTIVDGDKADEECSTINDQKTLTRLKAVTSTYGRSIDRRSKILYLRGVKA